MRFWEQLLGLRRKGRRYPFTVAILLVAMLVLFLSAINQAKAVDDATVRVGVLLIAGVSIFIASLAQLSIIFWRIGLDDARYALGLPEGSVRAVIALTLILLFTILSVFLYIDVANKTTPEVPTTTTAASAARAAALAEPVAQPTTTTTAPPATTTPPATIPGPDGRRGSGQAAHYHHQHPGGGPGQLLLRDQLGAVGPGSGAAAPASRRRAGRAGGRDHRLPAGQRRGRDRGPDRGPGAVGGDRGDVRRPPGPVL